MLGGFLVSVNQKTNKLFCEGPRNKRAKKDIKDTEGMEKTERHLAVMDSSVLHHNVRVFCMVL